MSSQEGPKLYTNKPKKAKLKQLQEQQKVKDFSSPSPTKPTSSLSSSSSSSQSAAAASYKMGSQSGPPPPPSDPQLPKDSFLRRNKFLVPLLLTVNLVVGAYLFMRTKKKDAGPGEEVTVTSVASTATQNAQLMEKPTSLHPMPRDPILENEQRELLKWILEEKRKLKPKDPEEKKRIDAEKDILKQFIQAKSIPSI